MIGLRPISLLLVLVACVAELGACAYNNSHEVEVRKVTALWVFFTMESRTLRARPFVRPLGRPSDLGMHSSRTPSEPKFQSIDKASTPSFLRRKDQQGKGRREL